jgi:hypothetical protein
MPIRYDGEAFALAREAQAVGLIVTRMKPRRCGSDMEYDVTLWCPDGRLWAEGTHETADQIRSQHLAGYRQTTKAGQR